MGLAAALEAALADILGPEAMLTGEGAAAYAVAGLAPTAAVRPATVEQLAAVMRLAHARGLAVLPWGGGTMMGLGNPPRRYDLAVDMRHLDRVLEHEPADLTCTVEAGIAIADLRSRLAAAGQTVGLDPPWPERATVGGTLATAIAGPRRYTWGHPRDFTIGMRVVLADGRITRAGGKVVKNVAGYDLCKLYIGSLGTLAIIVEATFKLLPLPRASAGLAFSFPGPGPACQTARELWRRGLAVTGMALQTQGGQYELLVDLGGSPGAVARSQREATELAVAQGGREAGSEPFWQEALASPVASRHLTVRLTVLPSRLAEALASLEALGPTLVVAFPTVGHIYARWPEEADARAVVGQALAVARAVGGTGVVHSWPWLAASAPLVDVWGPPPPSAALMRRVKEAWDPAGVLAPGRMVAGI